MLEASVVRAKIFFNGSEIRAKGNARNLGGDRRHSDQRIEDRVFQKSVLTETISTGRWKDAMRRNANDNEISLCF